MNETAATNLTKSLVDSGAGGDYDLDLSDFDYDPSWVENVGAGGGEDAISSLLKTLQKPEVMGAIEDMLKDSWKFIRLADDLHDIRAYLNDMRLCFIALTISGYVGLLIYLLILCIRKSRSGRKRHRMYECGSDGADSRLESQVQSPMTFKYNPPAYTSRAKTAGTGGRQETNPDGLRHPMLLANNTKPQDKPTHFSMGPKKHPNGPLDDIEHV